MGSSQSSSPEPQPAASAGTVFGLMQHHELMVSSLLEHAERNHPEVEIVSRRVEGDIHRYTYRDLAQRARQCANALDTLSLQSGDRVATMCWNGYRHLEVYFAVSCTKRVLHTLNPRLSIDQLVYICNHAEDRVLFFDSTFLPLIKQVHRELKTVEYFVMMCDDLGDNTSGVPNLVSYEVWLKNHDSEYVWPVFDERTASSLCYTSGTTNHPKGVLYSHRSTVLHAMASALPDTLNLSARDCILAVVPMFHVNAWGIPFSSCMVGAKLVLPGPAMDGKSIYELLEKERVNFAAGVPTVWQMLLQHTSTHGLKFSTLQRTVIGGSACPPSMLKMFKDEYKVDVVHAWGMTELSPLGSVCRLKNAQVENMTEEEQFNIQLKQGRAPFGVEMKITDCDNGQVLPWDGKQAGNLLVKGHWVIEKYYRAEKSALDKQGYFDTGDVAVLDEYGFMQITDRSKDMVKSGGEWISSIDVENIAMAHPKLAMAACIGIKHPKWDERPIIVCTKKPNLQEDVTKQDVLKFFEGKLAKWQIPDDCVFLDAIPLGATGKMQKTKIRELLHDYVLPSSRE